MSDPLGLKYGKRTTEKYLGKMKQIETSSDFRHIPSAPPFQHKREEQPQEPQKEKESEDDTILLSEVLNRILSVQRKTLVQVMKLKGDCFETSLVTRRLSKKVTRMSEELAEQVSNLCVVKVKASDAEWMKKHNVTKDRNGQFARRR
jgi:hypothetical protein